MSITNHISQLNKLCSELELGQIIGTPSSISGGLLHKLFAVETSKGCYAIKVLNAEIMQRPTAVQNFIKSEAIANIASKFLPALPANTVNGETLHEVDEQYFLVFNWVDGVILTNNEVTTNHCEKMGQTLADLHAIDFSELGHSNSLNKKFQLFDWASYLKGGELQKAEWVHQLLESVNLLYEWNDRANKAASQLSSILVTSHRDLEPKNVMWIGDQPMIIDWESAGEVNPTHDLIDTAIYWSTVNAGKIDKKRFIAFINGYKKQNRITNANWDQVLDHGFLGKLGWLDYSFKRSLRIESTNKEEQQVGTNHVIETIHALKQYADQIGELKKWIYEEID